MTDDEIEREALNRASRALGIPLSEPGAEEHLRKSLAFAGARLGLASRALFDEVTAPLVRLMERVNGWLERRHR